LDDPLPSACMLLISVSEIQQFLPQLLLIAVFFIAATWISALERIVGDLSEADIELVDTKYGRHLLAKSIRNQNRLQASFLVSKYFFFTCLIFLFQSLFQLIFSEKSFLWFVSAMGLSLLAYCLAFLLSRLIAARKSGKFMRSSGFVILLNYYLLLPFTYLFLRVSSYFEKGNNTGHSALSMDELSRALDLSENENTNSEEHKLLKGIVTFGTMDITRIMKPKMDIAAFDFNMPYRKLISNILASGYSRMPVYREDIDHIVGVLYIKDLISHLDEKDDFNWQALLRPCFFIPENTKPDDLLREFQQKKTHLAIVVDEFGQTAGLVTLEDIIEEIVGEINDEFDDDEIVYSKLDDQNYIFEGKTSMNDFLRIIGRSEESISGLKSDADTLSGFIIEQAGRFPEKNDKVNWEYYTFTIESADSRRIKRVKVTVRKKPSQL
jgi:putative hemolysin